MNRFLPINGLTALFSLLALLLAGCGEEAQKEAVQNEAKDDPSVPLLIPCEACKENVSKKTDKCPGCGHPAVDSVDAYVKEQKRLQELAEIRAAEVRKAKNYGGAAFLDLVREARANGDTSLCFPNHSFREIPLKKLMNGFEAIGLGVNGISDLSELSGLTELKQLSLGQNLITDISPLKDLANLEELDLGQRLFHPDPNPLTLDLTPLIGLTNLKELSLGINGISDLSPLKGLTNLEKQ